MRPLTLTTPEVRELLDKGSVVVRRAINFPVLGPTKGNKRRIYTDDPRDVADLPKVCPLGSPGEKRWVREKYGVDARSHRVEYAVDWGPNQEGCMWRSPVTMPRWASRLTLELAAVRVERDGTGWVWVTDWRKA